jgi:hypothetical protein
MLGVESSTWILGRSFSFLRASNRSSDIVVVFLSVWLKNRSFL